MIETRSEPDQQRLDRGGKKATRILPFSFHTIFISTKIRAPSPPSEKHIIKPKDEKDAKSKKEREKTKRNETKEKKPMNVND